jgi:hypothetical protein
MLKMKSDTPTQTAAEAAADSMRAAIAGLRKPAALELAERNLAAVRVKRAETAAAQNRRCREFNGKTPIAVGPNAEIRAGAAELVACDEAIRASRVKLDQARAAFAPAFLGALADPMRDIATEIAAHIIEIESLVEALADARRAAERLGLEAPTVMRCAMPPLIFVARSAGNDEIDFVALVPDPASAAQRQADRVAGDAGRHRVRRRPDLWRVRPAEL